MNPGSYADFGTVNGQRCCREIGAVTRLGCGMSVIVPPVEDLAAARYMKCSRLMVEK
jgi:hypothetical protein